LSGRGLCDELITHPEESYRLWCVVVCDLETSRIGAPYIYDISILRVKLHSCRKTPERIKGCMFGAHAWWTLASATLILKMFLDLLINVIVVHRAAIWAWFGWVWQGMGSAAVWIYASCYPACSLVEEPGWGMRCHCTLKKTVGSCNRKWVKVRNVGLQNAPVMYTDIWKYSADRSDILAAV